MHPKTHRIFGIVGCGDVARHILHLSIFLYIQGTKYCLLQIILSRYNVCMLT